MIEKLKAAGLGLTDILNRLNDPFDDFDRPPFPKDPKKLGDLEVDFYSDLINNFWVCDGQVLASRLPLPLGSEIDMGDQAIWHGVYTAMLALRYSALSPSVEVVSNQDSYAEIIQAAKGLQLHQTGHNEPKPRLVRGFSNDLKEFKDDASNDSACGHLLGIYFGWKFGPPTLRPVFEQLAGGLAAELHNHEDSLVGPDGKATTYGALVQGWRTDPLRLTLALAIYAVAATLCREKTFIQDYERLFRRYKAIIPYAKARLWWYEKFPDTHRAAIQLAILSDLTDGEPRECYRNGLRRVLGMTLKDGNLWGSALCAFGLSFAPAALRPQALKVLSEFSPKEKQFNIGRDNSTPEADRRIREMIPNFSRVLWNGVYMANEPLPRWMVRTQDFFWQRNLRSLDPGDEHAPVDSRLNGGDFLAAYWLLRHLGVLTPND
jgi:hypothetical protein